MGKDLFGAILGAAMENSGAIKGALSGEGISGELMARVAEKLWEKIEPMLGELGALESVKVAAKKGELPQLILKGVSGAKKMLGIADALGGKAEGLLGMDIGALAQKLAGDEDAVDALCKGLSKLLGEKLGKAVKVERGEAE